MERRKKLQLTGEIKSIIESTGISFKANRDFKILD